MNSNINDELREKLNIVGIVENMSRAVPSKLSDKHDKLVETIDSFLKRIGSVTGPDQAQAIRKNPILTIFNFENRAD